MEEQKFLYEKVSSIFKQYGDIIEKSIEIKTGSIGIDARLLVDDFQRMLRINIKVMARTFDTYHSFGSVDEARVLKYWIRSLLEDYLKVFGLHLDLEADFEDVVEKHIETFEQRKEEAFERQTA
tara:strand:- start:414 stop:785 length:372 start_codon:yes stop_codon:yes gene_type:complete